MSHFVSVNWADNIRQALSLCEATGTKITQVALRLKKERQRLNGAESKELSQAEELNQKLFERWKKITVKAFEARWEFEELDTLELTELDQHYAKALKFFKGDRARAVGAAAVQLQLYKIGNFFAETETKRLLNNFQPVKVQRKKRAQQLRPAWVPLAECARIVGINRNTVGAWHRQGFQVIDGEDGPQKIILKRHPGNGRVNLSLVEFIATRRRAAAAPGKPLGRPPGNLVGAVLASRGKSPQAAQAQHCLKALTAIEKLQAPGLLLRVLAACRARIRLRKKQDSKPQRGRTISYNENIHYQD